VSHADPLPQPPARLRSLVSWQTGRVATLGTRLTGRRMPLGARADFAVLAALEEYGALSQAEIGRRLGLDRNDVNGILNRLERDGRVQRRADPADRRRNVVTITDVGVRYLEEIQAHADDVQAELLGALDESERRQLQALLAKVLDGHQPQPS
jgi:DNA-binding MarR family transcriptional regulator